MRDQNRLSKMLGEQGPTGPEMPPELGGLMDLLGGGGTDPLRYNIDLATREMIHRSVDQMHSLTFSDGKVENAAGEIEYLKAGSVVTNRMEFIDDGPCDPHAIAAGCYENIQSSLPDPFRIPGGNLQWRPSVTMDETGANPAVVIALTLEEVSA